MTEPPQQKRCPNFTDEELHALIAAVISRKVPFSKFGWKIKFNDYRAIVKKTAGEKKYVGGTGKYCNLKCFKFKLN